jgi:hypothetical protein
MEKYSGDLFASIFIPSFAAILKSFGNAGCRGLSIYGHSLKALSVCYAADAEVRVGSIGSLDEEPLTSGLPPTPDILSAIGMSQRCQNRTHAAQQKNSYWIVASPSGPTGIAGISMPGRLAVHRLTSVAPPATPSARGKCLTPASVRENPPIRHAVIIDY